MSNEFELVLIRVIHCTPIISILINEQLIINCDIIEEIPVLGMKNEHIHFDLLVTFLCCGYYITFPGKMPWNFAFFCFDLCFKAHSTIYTYTRTCTCTHYGDVQKTGSYMHLRSCQENWELHALAVLHLQFVNAVLTLQFCILYGVFQNFGNKSNLQTCNAVLHFQIIYAVFNFWKQMQFCIFWKHFLPAICKPQCCKSNCKKTNSSSNPRDN